MARSTVMWTLLAAAALLWPARMIGALDGIPLDGRLDAMVIGLAVPALWWLDRGFLARRFARTLIVALLGWKVLLAVAAVPHGLCARFTTSAPFAGEVQTIPIEEPHGILRSWDVRADWRAAQPSCTAVVDRAYGDAASFPAWFVNLIDFIKPGARQITLDLTGYVRAREPGTFALQVGSDMQIEGTLGGVALAVRSDRAEVPLAPGVHHLVARSSMTGQHWKLVPLWNGGNAWSDLELTTAPPSWFDRLLWPIAGTVTVALVVLLVGGWSASAFAQFDRRVVGWSAAASIAAIVLAGSSRFDRLGGALLLGAILVPVARSARRLNTAFVLLGVPWLVFFAAQQAAQIGRMTAYSADDWLTYQVAGYRIFMNGFWLEAGSRVFDYQPLYRWMTGGLHVVFGDSSIGEVYWDAACVLAGAMLCVQLVKPVAGFAMAIAAGALMLAAFTLGTPWYFVGRGLSEIAAAGWAFLAASFLLRARLGFRSAAAAAGVFAVLMFYTRLNHLLFAGCLLALLWPARTPARLAAVRRSLAAVSIRAAAIYAACFAIGLALFAARTWHYTGVFSLFYGTSLKNNDTGLRLTTLGSPDVWAKVGHSLNALVWMNEPPGFDPRALVVFAGAILAVLALLQVPRLNRLPFRIAAAGAGAMLGSLFVHTHNYPGRMSIHLMPFAVALSVVGFAAVLPARLRTWQPGDRYGRRTTAQLDTPAAIDTGAARLSRKKRRLFGAVAVAFALLTTVCGLLAMDIYLHRKYERSGGFNVWGYRGPAVGRKQPGEYRVAMLGGSTAYGYGVEWNEAIPAVLEQQLKEHQQGNRYTVVNLGYNNEGAYSFTFTLKDYESLQYDLACLYEGYNDMIGDPRLTNLSVFRHDSPIFRLTGYLPIFPIIFKEKAASMLNGDTGAVYHPEEKTVFRPGLAKRATADVLATAAAVGESLERQLDRAVAEPPRRISDAESIGCKYPWGDYCRSMSNAIEYALARNRQVMVITQPYRQGALRARHMEQQHELATMLERRFAGERRLRYVNLGEVVDVGNPQLSFDGMHLTAAGNRPVAAALVAPVVEMAAAREMAALGKDVRP
jgi:hypothetical protein